MGYEHQGRKMMHANIEMLDGTVHVTHLVPYGNLELLQDWFDKAAPDDTLVIENRIHHVLPEAPIFDKLTNADKPGVRIESHTIVLKAGDIKGFSQ